MRKEAVQAQSDMHPRRRGVGGMKRFRHFLSRRVLGFSLVLVFGWTLFIFFAFVRLSTIINNRPTLVLRDQTRESPAATTKTGQIRGKRQSNVKILVQESENVAPRELPLSNEFMVDCRDPYRTIGLLLGNADDPFLPWIHDYYWRDGSVHFVSQNKRRCHTGKSQAPVMRRWEGQIANFQPVYLRRSKEGRLLLTEPTTSTINETRFLCRFHDGNDGWSQLTFSQYPFNYEYMNWRKRGSKPMFVKNGPDVEIFDTSTLLFSCPVPKAAVSPLLLDVIPIRMPARYDEGYLLAEHHVGPTEFATLKKLDVTSFMNNQTELPRIKDVGRIENLPLCPIRGKEETMVNTRKASSVKLDTSKHKHLLVACTWVAARYTRRGGRGASVSDTPERLREWIAWKRLTGFDHVYVYDNTQADKEGTANFPLKKVADLFPDFVTWIHWPVKVCNDNFIGGRWPGERSSQYAAEQSCRSRFGPSTEWMSFLDIDEYLVPLNNQTTWQPFLRENKRPVLGFRESRAKPRFELLSEANEGSCTRREEANAEGERQQNISCLVANPRPNETYLELYNCDSIKPPRPWKYFVNMKQIYRPAFVQYHFIHYSAITVPMSKYYKDRQHGTAAFERRPSRNEKGLSMIDELTEGVMLHARSVLGHQTTDWKSECSLNSKRNCAVGFTCPSSTSYDDKLLEKNAFLDNNGRYCNCWRNPQIDRFIPLLRTALQGLAVKR